MTSGITVRINGIYFAGAKNLDEVKLSLGVTGKTKAQQNPYLISLTLADFEMLVDSRRPLLAETLRHRITILKNLHSNILSNKDPIRKLLKDFSFSIREFDFYDDLHHLFDLELCRLYAKQRGEKYQCPTKSEFLDICFSSMSRFEKIYDEKFSIDQKSFRTLSYFFFEELRQKQDLSQFLKDEIQKYTDEPVKIDLFSGDKTISLRFILSIGARSKLIVCSFYGPPFTIPK